MNAEDLSSSASDRLVADSAADATSDSAAELDWRQEVQRHVRFAWWSLLVFLGLGIALEAFHGFKVPWYLNVGMENRRLMWTLGHSTGAILAIFHGAFAATIYALPRESASWRWLASPLLISSSFLLPGGFLLGGYFLHQGEPGLGLIFLVPIGATFLLAAVLTTAVGVCLRPSAQTPNDAAA